MSEFRESNLPDQTEIDVKKRERELEKLSEILERKDASLVPIGEAGYLVHNNRVPYIAEAPLVLMDWDDTAVDTAGDKEKCWGEVENLGLSRDVIAFCDKLSRIGEEPIYSPEIEMRLITRALQVKTEDSGPVELSENLKQELQRTRDELEKKIQLDEIPVSSQVRNVYQRTRFSSSPYPDTIETLKRLRGGEDTPSNVAILTFGDPSFQLEKTADLLDNTSVNQIFLTRTKKGDFFKQVIEQNPYKDIKLSYRYKETPRGAGIDFKNWQIMVVLFDDDPNQVTSFNKVANEAEIKGLGVVRIRRSKAKKQDVDIESGRLVAEIHPSDTYLDSALFEQTLVELQDKILEDFLVNAVRNDGREALDMPNLKQIISTLAQNRKSNPKTIEAIVLKNAEER